MSSAEDDFVFVKSQMAQEEEENIKYLQMKLDMTSRRLQQIEKQVKILQKEEPVFREYSSLASRQRTFNMWGYRPLRPRPLKLAKAGFFYTGRGDVVQCFYCGVKLKNWVSCDVPYKEHCKFSPNCRYMYMTRVCPEETDLCK